MVLPAMEHGNGAAVCKMVMSEKIFLDEIFSFLNTLSDHILKKLFGVDINSRLFHSINWADVGVMLFFAVLFLILNLTAFLFLRNRIKQSCHGHPFRSSFYNSVGKPVYALIWIAGVYFIFVPVILKLIPATDLALIKHILENIFLFSFLTVFLWILLRVTYILEKYFLSMALRTENKIDDLLVPFAFRSFRVVAPVILAFLIVQITGLSPQTSYFMSKLLSIILIAAIALILSNAVGLGEKVALVKFDINTDNNLKARKIYTQIHVLSKLLYSIIVIFAVATILMLFKEVRHIGTSILATAGVMGIIIGFAAQKTISNLFAGFQLAITQPIRLDDVVIVEGEWGRVEEITLTYVVIHIWDDRRLIVPLSYFIEKPFQNWTRNSADILGVIEIWADYSLPVKDLRKDLEIILEKHPLWDKRFWNLQITDVTEKAMLVRVLATSSDSSKSWDLRCDIREQLLELIHDKYPDCLPKIRITQGKNRTFDKYSY
jgi:small-conductance mechanosensitive channel